MIFSPRSARCLALCPLLAVALSLSSAQAAPVPGDKVAVLPLALEGNVPARPVALDNAVLKGLEVVVGAARVMVGPAVTQKLTANAARAACTDARCWMSVGKALGARHLVSGLVQRKDAFFEVEFRLIDALDGLLVHTEVNKCEASECSVADLCRLTVLDLARKGLGKATPAPAAAAAASPAPVAPAATPSPGPSASRPPAPSSPAATTPPPLPAAAPPVGAASNELVAAAPAKSGGSSWRSWYPAVSIASGVVVAAAGGYLIYKEGDCTKPNMSPCKLTYENLPGGIAALTGGVLLAASGVVVGLLGNPNEQAHSGKPRVAIGLGTLSLSGKF